MNKKRFSIIVALMFSLVLFNVVDVFAAQSCIYVSNTGHASFTQGSFASETTKCFEAGDGSFKFYISSGHVATQTGIFSSSASSKGFSCRLSSAEGFVETFYLSAQGGHISLNVNTFSNPIKVYCGGAVVVPGCVSTEYLDSNGVCRPRIAADGSTVCASDNQCVVGAKCKLAYTVGPATQRKLCLYDPGASCDTGTKCYVDANTAPNACGTDNLCPKMPVDGVCNANSQCESGNCDTTNEVCLEAGATVCPAGQYQDISITPYECKDKINVGQQCTPKPEGASDISEPCAGDSTCQSVNVPTSDGSSSTPMNLCLYDQTGGDCNSETPWCGLVGDNLITCSSNGVCGGTGATCTPETQEEVCVSEVCDSVTRTCTAPQSGGNGEQLAEGNTRSGNDENQPCSNNLDCLPGLSCVSETCQQAEEHFCTRDIDCAPNQVCGGANTCVEIGDPTTCNSRGGVWITEKAACVEPCSTDAQCFFLPFAYCDLDMGSVFNSELNGKGMCVELPWSCQNNPTVCGEGQVCSYYRDDQTPRCLSGNYNKLCDDVNGVACSRGETCQGGTSFELSTSSFCCVPHADTPPEDLKCVSEKKTFVPAYNGELFVVKGPCVDGKRTVQYCTDDAGSNCPSEYDEVESCEMVTKRGSTADVPGFAFSAGVLAVLLIFAFYLFFHSRFKKNSAAVNAGKRAGTATNTRKAPKKAVKRKG